jgi:GxxExxY protein
MIQEGKMPLDPNIPCQDITYKIIGAAMRVHGRLGPGVREKHYQRALLAELREVGLEASEEYSIDIHDREQWIGRLYLDILVEKCVIVETKAFPHLITNEEVAQVICYLAATGLKVGLLLNGRKRLEYKRILPPKILDGWQDRIQRFSGVPKIR